MNSAIFSSSDDIGKLVERDGRELAEPADLVKHVPEVAAGYPDRLLPIDDAAAEALKKRTLTNLYHKNPT